MGKPPTHATRENKVCPTCGEFFTPKTAKQKLCSQACNPVRAAMMAKKGTHTFTPYHKES